MLFVILAISLLGLSLQDCRDNHRYCPIWAEAGMCDPRVDNGYVIPNCKKSCRQCVEVIKRYLTMAKPLTSKSLREGQSLLLEARARGEPLPSVKLEFEGRDGVRRMLDATVHVGIDNTVIVSYHIPEIKLEDGGVYIATFSNGISYEETRSIVNVTRVLRDPKIIISQGLKTIEVKKGGELNIEVEVESDVRPDHAILYHYVDDRWNVLQNFDFYTFIPGKYIGRYHKKHADKEDNGDYMFSVGTRNIIKKSFGSVSVMVKQAILEFVRVPGNVSVVEGDSLTWSVDIRYYPQVPDVRVYKVRDYLWERITENEELRLGYSHEQLFLNYVKRNAEPEDAGNFVVLISGNGLNRKLLFRVDVVSAEKPTEVNLIDDGIIESGYDNAIRYDDEPGAMEFEPVFVKELSNLTGSLGDEVKLNVVASGDKKFQVTLLKVDSEQETLLAGASPAPNSNWLNLTYIIDSLEGSNQGLYKAVLLSGGHVKNSLGYITITDTNK